MRRQTRRTWWQPRLAPRLWVPVRVRYVAGINTTWQSCTRPRSQLCSHRLCSCSIWYVVEYEASAPALRIWTWPVSCRVLGHLVRARVSTAATLGPVAKRPPRTGLVQLLQRSESESQRLCQTPGLFIITFFAFVENYVLA